MRIYYPFSNFLDKTQPSEHMWNIAISSGICVFVHAKTLSHPNPLSFLCFFGGSDGKESACIAGDPGSIPGSGRPPREGNGYPFQYSCLENSHGQRILVGYCPWGSKKLDAKQVKKQQSGPGLVFVDCIELLHLWLERISSVWFRYWPSGDVHV